MVAIFEGKRIEAGSNNGLPPPFCRDPCILTADTLPISNRRAFRIAVESLDLFRRYMAVYAREQAYCHFSPALIANLERYWNAQNRAD